MAGSYELPHPGYADTDAPASAGPYSSSYFPDPPVDPERQRIFTAMLDAGISIENADYLLGLETDTVSHRIGMMAFKFTPEQLLLLAQLFPSFGRVYEQKIAESKFMREDVVSPQPGLLPDAFSNVPSPARASPVRRTQSVSAEVERIMSKPPSPTRRIDDEDVSLESKSGDDEMVDAEEGVDLPPPLRPGVPKLWQNVTPDEYASGLEAAIKQRLLVSDIPNVYLVRAAQAVYDTLEIVCQTKRFTVQGKGYATPAPIISTPLGRSKSREEKSRGRSRGPRRGGEKTELAKQQADLKKRVLVPHQARNCRVGSQEEHGPSAEEAASGPPEAGPQEPLGQGYFPCQRY
jgi:hypothetical protein